MRPSSRDRLLYVPIGLILLIWIFPILWTALTSLKSPGGLTGLTPKFIFAPTIDNYTALFTDQQYGTFLRNSLFVAGGATILAMLISILAAYTLSRARIRGREQIGIWILSLRMLPPIVVIVPFYLIFNEADLLDTYQGLILVYMSFSLPFAIWLLTGFFAEVPTTLDQAAAADGAKPAKILFRIVVPNSRAGIAVTAMLTFVFAWNEFLFAFLLTQKDWVTLPVKLGSTTTPFQTDYGTLTAGGMLSFLPLIIIVFFMQREMVRGMSFGAVR
jgi:multiple sugar transport system permease protein